MVICSPCSIPSLGGNPSFGKEFLIVGLLSTSVLTQPLIMVGIPHFGWTGGIRIPPLRSCGKLPMPGGKGIFLSRLQIFFPGLD